MIWLLVDASLETLKYSKDYKNCYLKIKNYNIEKDSKK